MIINVTYQDIEKGNESIDACPITIALRRDFGDKVSVSRNFIRVPKKRSKDKWTLIPLPLVARSFLLNHYKYNAPQAFSFMLPDKSIKILKKLKG